MTNIKAKKVILKNRDGEHLIPITDVDALNYKNITNCLLEVPQNIKLELADGVLTLKAGSKVIVPNGVEVFNEVSINSDVQVGSGGAAGNKFWLYEQATNQLKGVIISNCYTGGSAPSGTSYQVWYNTSENKIYTDWGKTGTWVEDGKASFPLCTFTSDGTSIISIDQVFNGMGYIGSTYWIDKGVKGLIPNGRNTDGSLNNIEFTTPKLATATLTAYTNNNMPFGYNVAQNKVGWSDWLYVQEEKPNDNYSHWYKPSQNILYYAGATTGDYQPIKDLICGFLGRTNGIVTEWNPKETFHAVDYNDLQGKVSKTGDTMSGKLSFNGVPEGGHIIMTTNRADIVNVRTHHPDFDFTTTTAPSAHKYLQRFIAYDKNNQYTSYIETMHHTNNNIFTNVGVRRSISGTAKTAYVQVGIDVNGNTFCNFPKCSTKATTTSSATNTNIAVITQNYKSGTTWRRIWSDGWIEQGGKVTVTRSNYKATITFPKAFSDTNYNIMFTAQSSDAAYFQSDNINVSNDSSKITKTSIEIASEAGNTFYWRACGY